MGTDARTAQPIEWATFDCYGTLIDWEAGIRSALAPFLPPGAATADLGDRYIEAEAEIERGPYRPYGDTLKAAARLLFQRQGWTLPNGSEGLLPESLPNWSPFPEAALALGGIRRAGVRLAILSNVDRALIAASVERLGVKPDLIVTAEDCRSYKPAHGHWRRFQSESGAAPEVTLHVGASIYHDVVPATALGYRTVFVNRKDEPIGSASPWRVVPDLALLPKIVGEATARGFTRSGRDALDRAE